MSIRFHLDENLSPAVADQLVICGVDVTTSQQVGLLGESDDDQLSFAIAHERVLVTHDRDFARIDATGRDHLGICYCHRDKYSIGELIEMIVLVHECFKKDEIRNHLEYL